MDDWEYGERDLTRENVVRKGFPREDRGDLGHRVAVVSEVALELFCGRSPPGI